MRDHRSGEDLPPQQPLLDQLLSIPRTIYLGGVALGTAIAAVPLLAINVVA